MRIFNKFRGTRGFVSGWEREVRFRYMITEQAKHRTRILAFRERHGDAAAREAFGVSRRTLFRWQAVLKKSGGKLEGLNAASTAPIRRRTRHVPSGLPDRLITLRKEHPRLGKDKLQALLLPEGYTASVSTIGRILSDLKKPRPAFPVSTLLPFREDGEPC